MQEAANFFYPGKSGLIDIELRYLFQNSLEIKNIPIPLLLTFRKKCCILWKIEVFYWITINDDCLRIASGPLKGLETDVIRRDDGNDSIIVNISILEQHVEYSVSAGELKNMMN